MKKHQPPKKPLYPEVLYTQVNKPSRRQQPSQTTSSSRGVGVSGNNDNSQDHLYEEVDVSRHGRNSPQPSIDSVYTTLGSNDNPQTLENVLYEPLGSGVNPQGEEASPDPIAESVYRPQEFVANPNPIGESEYSPQGFVTHPDPIPQTRRGPQKTGVSPYSVTNLLGDDGKDPPGVGVGPYSISDLFGKDGELLPRPTDSPYEEVTRGRETPTPAKNYFPEILGQNVKIQYGQEEIRHWCGLVYGNKHALDQKLTQVLENPRGAEQVLYELLENPETGGRLAGTQALGIKSPKRKEAESDFGPLCAAFERHVSVVQRVQKELTHQHGQHKGHKHRQEHPERHGEHRSHHRARSEERHSPQQETQHRRHSHSKGGQAFAM
ncbi:hypothetical protein ABID39_001581 [Bartonella japonica]|uniref:BID domain-containing T4SS effector n=1 Tax=Bartonella japonica TaxID=357761 RepID=A0ABV2FQL6_9HYPH